MCHNNLPVLTHSLAHVSVWLFAVVHSNYEAGLVWQQQRCVFIPRCHWWRYPVPCGIFCTHCILCNFYYYYYYSWGYATVRQKFLPKFCVLWMFSYTCKTGFEMILKMFKNYLLEAELDYVLCYVPVATILTVTASSVNSWRWHVCIKRGKCRLL